MKTKNIYIGTRYVVTRQRYEGDYKYTGMQYIDETIVYKMDECTYKDLITKDVLSCDYRCLDPGTIFLNVDGPALIPFDYFVKCASGKLGINIRLKDKISRRQCFKIYKKISKEIKKDSEKTQEKVKRFDLR